MSSFSNFSINNILLNAESPKTPVNARTHSSKPTQSNYLTMSMSQKRKYVETYINHYNSNASAFAADHDFIDRFKIARWAKNIEAYTSFSGNPVARNLYYSRSAKYPKLENKLYHWIINRRLDSKRSVRPRVVRRSVKVKIHRSKLKRMFLFD